MLFNEPKLLKWITVNAAPGMDEVSVLFNEPKLLKSPTVRPSGTLQRMRFSALQRAEIAEIATSVPRRVVISQFQYSSTSRNC